MSRSRRRTAATVAVATACLTAATALPAGAATSGKGGGGPVGIGGGSTGTSGGGGLGVGVYSYPIVVTATGTGGHTIESYSVPSPPPICGYFAAASGPDLAKDWASNPYGFAHYNEQPAKPPGLDDHATDKDGYWYADECTDDGSIPFDQFDTISTAFFAANPDWYWVATGATPPIPAVPSATLAASAFKTIPLPALQVSRNPDGNAVTQLPTWFWYDRDVSQTVTVTASIPGTRYTAKAVAVVAGLEVTVPALGIDKTCADGGTPYSAGASSDCTVTFDSTNGTAGYTVNESADWTASYTGWDQATPVALKPQVTTTTQQVPVREIDSVVTHG